MNVTAHRTSVQEFAKLIESARMRVWTWVQLTPETGFYTDGGKSAVKDALAQVEYPSESFVSYFYATTEFYVYVGGPEPTRENGGRL